METFVVEAIRQLPALVLAVLVIYFYRSAQSARESTEEAAAVPDHLMDKLEGLVSRANQFDARLQSLREQIDAHSSGDNDLSEEREAIRSQLSNQKMALKEFGRVLSKTSEQTYTEFTAFEERLREVESILAKRGQVNDESRPAA
jgi:uncharacterized protein YoxC